MREQEKRERGREPEGDDRERRPWTRPAIAEEEAFQTYALACAEKQACGILIPKS